MLLDLRGADFLRVQGQAQSRIGDPLDPDVLFSGAFPDGQAMFFQAAVDAGSNIGSVSGTTSFGRTLSVAPIVLGCIRLSQAYTGPDGVTRMNAREYIAPCRCGISKSGVGRRAYYAFEFLATSSQIQWTVGGFKGTLNFFVIELG